MRARIIIIGVLGLAARAQAAGFAVSEQGAASFGIAGAATSRADLPERGYYNPAALVLTPGLSAAVGATAIRPNVTHIDPASGDQTPARLGVETPPYVYAGYGMDRFALGVAFGVPFGSGISWPTDPSWRGRFEITDIVLRTYELAPTVAVKVVDGLALAAGPRFVMGNVYMSRKVPLGSTEGNVELGGDSHAVGGQVALLAGPFGPLTLGLTYRSRVTLTFDGQANFDDVPLEFSPQAHDGGVRTGVTLPDRAALGGTLALGSVKASLDFEYFGWSTMKDLSIDFTDDATPDVKEPRDWVNTLAVRAGVEVSGLAEGLALRAGLCYDPTPSPRATLSPSLPDGNRVLATAGGSYALGGGIAAHAGLGHVFFLGAESEGDAFPGQYKASATLASLGLSYTP